MKDFSLYKNNSTNQYYAIKNLRNIDMNLIKSIVIIEDKELPIWKQAMYAQMGKLKDKQEVRNLLNVQYVNKEDCPKNIVCDVFEIEQY